MDDVEAEMPSMTDTKVKVQRFLRLKNWYIFWGLSYSSIFRTDDGEPGIVHPEMFPITSHLMKQGQKCGRKRLPLARAIRD